MVCAFKENCVYLQIESRLRCAVYDTENMNDSQLALLGRARAYCAAAEQCVSAVEQKLRSWGADEASTEAVAARLVEEGYLDDRRYARAYCESKMLRSGWGRMKVLYQLRLKRLPREAVEAGMAAVDDEAYFAVLEETALKKRATLRDSDPAVRRRKLAAFLAQRGYSMDEINQILTKIKQQL